MSLLSRLWRLWTRVRRPDLPLRGFDEQRLDIPGLATLTDDDLRRLNGLLEWNTFVADAEGRRFGDVAWRGKRDAPQLVPDRRIVLLDERVGLSDKHVLEVGCFEGIHTIALCQRAKKVTAIDARVENVVKTIVRCAMFELHPTVRVVDVERGDAFARLGTFDVVHHVGVLYHLADPVRHLREAAAAARVALLLDTHYAAEAEESYESQGRSYRYQRYGEGGRSDVFSGMSSHAKWLRLDDLLELLRERFARVEVLEERAERNGPRVLILATT